LKHYNHIFAGAGLSSLMTVYKMILSNNFKDKTILLVDVDAKKTNDRTWCFWEKSGHDWENLVSQKWKTAIFANQEFSKNLNLSPFEYNMIRGLDFYNHVLSVMENYTNINFVNDKIINFKDNGSNVSVICESKTYSCDKLFNSIYNKSQAETQTKYPVLQQHFVGWFIKSEQAVFNADVATFMDFSLEQNGNTKFMYVLPTSTSEALLEPTLFSHKHLQLSEYENEIQVYIKKLGIKNFEIVDKERGSIPMTSYKFWKNNTKNVLNIGTAGGWTKASTGFTFYHTNKKSNQLIDFLKTEKDFTKFHKPSRFWFYDLIFMDVLDKKNHLGAAVFSALFQKGDSELIFKFLNQETTIWQEIEVMWRCPKIPFIKAFLRVLL
jgi:lycopene beta-cyclase